MSEFQEWSEQYDALINNPPKEGDILKPMEGKALLTIELREGAPPFVFGRCYVPEIVGEKVDWFLQSSEDQNFHGWKCILLPRARAELIKEYGTKSEFVEVSSLRVVRPSQSGKSLLCEIPEEKLEKE